MNQISFDISSVLLTDGGCKLKPNNKGVYEHIPLLVLNKDSRNKKHYDVDSMMNCINNANSSFNIRLNSGCLRGEWQHPITDDIMRIATIDMEKVSHLIVRVYADKPTEKGYVIVYGDIVPCPPFGKCLVEEFENPMINSGFSLRSLVTKTGEINGIIQQKVNALVTIDHVDCGGYPECLKRRVPAYEDFKEAVSYEGLEVAFDPIKGQKAMLQAVGCESIEDPQIQDILQANIVEVRHSLVGYFDKETNSIVSNEGLKSIFHKAFGGK